MTVTPQQFAAKMRYVARTVPKMERNVVERIADDVKRSVERQMRQAVGPEQRMSGIGKRGARIGARYDVFSTGDEVFALVKATGPAHIVERDTKPHSLAPRQKRRKPGRKRRVLVIPGVGVRAYAKHPGTKGKHPWEKGVAVASRQVGKAAQREVHELLVKVFG